MATIDNDNDNDMKWQRNSLSRHEIQVKYIVNYVHNNNWCDEDYIKTRDVVKSTCMTTCMYN